MALSLSPGDLSVIGHTFTLSGSFYIAYFQSSCVSSIFFLSMNNNPLYVCTTYYLSVNGHLSSFHLLAVKNNTILDVGVQISVLVFVLNSLGMYPVLKDRENPSQ